MERSTETLVTPSGLAEVEIRGFGTPVLVLHGSPGGIDAARAMARFLPEDRFRATVLSRPGYLGTPLDANDRSIDHEADPLTVVLGTLRVDRVGVFAWSGGGPSMGGSRTAFSTTVGTNGPRKAGWRNDVANYARIDSLELDRVQCPVLLIHGVADTDPLPEYSRSAHVALPDSTLVIMERGAHLAFYAHPEAPDIQEQARRWLGDHS